MSRPKYRIKDVISWYSLRLLEKITNHLTMAANDIEELGIVDIGILNELLMQRTGIHFYRLRDCCDAVMYLTKEQREIARDFDEFLNDRLPRQTETFVEDYAI